MIESRSTFLDTSPFIYWLENHPVFYPKIERYITEAVLSETRLVTSVLTYMEYSVRPQEVGRRDLIDSFLALTSALNCPLLPATFDICTTAYKLRATYKSLKGIDALQLATALETGCQDFVTNDKRLNIVSELNIIVLTDTAG
jgi:predicted nucleic acid-binding protein